jgi:hypothetical protein
VDGCFEKEMMSLFCSLLQVVIGEDSDNSELGLGYNWCKDTGLWTLYAFSDDTRMADRWKKYSGMDRR